MPNYRTTRLYDAEDLYKIFATLPPKKEAHWDFFRAQMQLHTGNYFACHRWLRKKLMRELPKTEQFGIVREREGRKACFQFRGETYPQHLYPRRQYQELYRETVTSLPETYQFWIDLHKDDVRQELLRERDEGNSKVIVALIAINNKVIPKNSLRFNSHRFLLRRHTA